MSSCVTRKRYKRVMRKRWEKREKWSHQIIIIILFIKYVIFRLGSCCAKRSSLRMYFFLSFLRSRRARARVCVRKQCIYNVNTWTMVHVCVLSFITFINSCVKLHRAVRNLRPTNDPNEHFDENLAAVEWQQYGPRFALTERTDRTERCAMLMLLRYYKL